MIKPPLLRPGDTIAITAPARKITPAETARAIEIFKSWGLQVRLSESLHSSQHSYLAGTDDERLRDIQTLINDRNVHAIVCARGGYGSTRIVDNIDFDSLKKNPKWIVGFSDITALHLKLLTEDIQSIHGTMPILFAKENAGQSIESLKQLLFEGLFSLTAQANEANRTGTANGQLVGGNLSLIVDSLGTSSEIQTENSILFIEEIDEYYYRLDRMMIHLKRSGKLSKLRGLAVGHFSDLKESELPFRESYQQIILNAVKDYDFPVGFGFQSGHDQPNLAWIQGEFVSFNVHDSAARIAPVSKNST